MESTYQTAISSTQISEERVVAPPPPALAVEATAGMTEPQHEFVFAPLHSTAAQGPASKQRSAVLMELYDERSRVLTELRSLGRGPRNVARRGHLEKFLADLEKYIDDIELEQDELLGSNKSYRPRAELDSLATKLLELQSRIESRHSSR